MSEFAVTVLAATLVVFVSVLLALVIYLQYRAERRERDLQRVIDPIEHGVFDDGHVYRLDPVTPLSEVHYRAPTGTPPVQPLRPARSIALQALVRFRAAEEPSEPRPGRHRLKDPTTDPIVLSRGDDGVATIE